MYGLGCVSHQSKKQPTVALSTCEAVNTSCQGNAMVTVTIIRISNRNTFSLQATKDTQDNTASIPLANGKGHRKHIDIKRQFCKEAVDYGLEYCENGKHDCRYINKGITNS
jgi:hypothetical protein